MRMRTQQKAGAAEELGGGRNGGEGFFFGFRLASRLRSSSAGPGVTLAFLLSWIESGVKCAEQLEEWFRSFMALLESPTPRFRVPYS